MHLAATVKQSKRFRTVHDLLRGNIIFREIFAHCPTLTTIASQHVLGNGGGDLTP
jgi:hypothetical protein